jgi:hypothetical protein
MASVKDHMKEAMDGETKQRMPCHHASAPAGEWKFNIVLDQVALAYRLRLSSIQPSRASPKPSVH